MNRSPAYEVVANLLRALPEADDRAGVARQALLAVCDMAASSHAAVLLLDDGLLTGVAGSGALRPLAGQAISPETYPLRKHFLCPDVAADPLFAALIPGGAVLSLVSVPLKARTGAPLGAMAVGLEAPGLPSPELCSQLEVVAEVASTALERIQGRQKLEAELRDKQALLRLSELLEGGTEGHIRQALEEILRVAGADAALVLHNDRGFYRPRLWAGDAPPPLRQIFENRITPEVAAAIIASLGTDFQVFDHGDHLLAPSMREVEVRAALVLGLNADDQLEALVLHRLRRAEGWGEAEAALLRSAARTLGAVITRVERAKQLEARNRELEIVAQVGQALNHSASLEEAAQALTRQIVGLTRADYASIKLVTPDGTGLRNLRAEGLPALTGDVVPRGRGLSWRSLESGQTQSAQAALSDPRVFVPAVAGVERWPGSVAHVPMFDAQGGPLGTLGLAYREEGQVRDDDLRTLEVIASIAASTLERLEADGRLRSRNRELEMMVNLSEALKRATSPEEVGQITLSRTLELTSSRSAVLFTSSPSGEELLPSLWAGGFRGWQAIPRPQGMAWDSWLNRELRFTPDALSDRGVFNPGDPSDLPRSRATVPLFGFDRQVVAVLGITRDAPGGFSPEELRVFRLIGEVASSALERVEATAQLMRQLHETQVLFNTLKGVVAPDARRGAESGAVWSDLLRAAVELVPGVEAGSLFLRDGEDFVMVAQHGYGDGLLGVRMNPQVETYWFGPQNDLRRGQPRIGRADFIAGAIGHSRAHLEPEVLDAFMGAGRMSEVRCTVCVPILEDGELAAYINLDSLSDEMALDAESVRVSQRFALQVAALVAARRHKEQLEAAYEEALRTIGLALEARDPLTAAHTGRVTRLALRLGEATGLAAQQLFNLRWGAYLHDIGKLAVPDSILFKSGALTPLERARFSRHAAEGEALTRQLSFLPEGARAVIRHHHERWDGTGYPDGLAGEAIPLKARIFAVCDVFDALLSERPYKPALTLEEACAELRRCAKTGHLDPRLVEVFLGLVPELFSHPPAPSLASERGGG